jgi:hypothetical protein
MVLSKAQDASSWHGSWLSTGATLTAAAAAAATTTTTTTTTQVLN